MHQSEVPIRKIEVITQTLASRVHQLRPLLTGDHAETLTRFQDPQDTDQSLRNPVTFGNFFGVVVLAQLSVDVFKRAS